jgi:Zn-dependent protease with chaperone function
VEAAVVVATIDRSHENREESGAIRANHRRAVRMCLVPGLVLGIIIGVVLAALGIPVYLAAVVFVVVAAGGLVILWQRAPGAVLRAVGAQPSREMDRPRLHNLVDGLCATMGLPQPTIAVVDSPVPNAMSIGRDPRTATLVVTSALDRYLTLVELEGVLAHELVHVKRHDTVLATVAVSVLAPFSLLMGLPSATERVHSLIGRGREFDADQRAAGVVRYPPGIGSALEAMLDSPDRTGPWPPGRGRTAALTRWLWVDPMVGLPAGQSVEGNLDDTRVRAAAQSLS